MLSDVTIVIPTFHRRGYLRDCLAGIRENLPECDVVVVSDDGVIPQTANEIYLPYDSGLTAKRNAGVAKVQTRHTLIGSDDFDFSTDEAREGIVRMARTLRVSEVNIGFEIDVLAGRVNQRPYEGTLEYVQGEYIKEHRVNFIWGLGMTTCLIRIDIAANYFIARTSVLRAFPWDESIRPIGGEHADWFLDLKEANMNVLFIDGVNINQMPYDASKQDPRYREYRRRALTTGHALMKKKRNIKQYIDFNGGVS
jgi:glycosyltransferase involved in cell wall biosynthesis